MAPLIVLKGEGPAVLPPGDVGEIIGVGEETIINVDLSFGLNME